MEIRVWKIGVPANEDWQVLSNGRRVWKGCSRTPRWVSRVTLDVYKAERSWPQVEQGPAEDFHFGLGLEVVSGGDVVGTMVVAFGVSLVAAWPWSSFVK